MARIVQWIRTGNPNFPFGNWGIASYWSTDHLPHENNIAEINPWGRDAGVFIKNGHSFHIGGLIIGDRASVYLDGSASSVAGDVTVNGGLTFGIGGQGSDGGAVTGNSTLTVGGTITIASDPEHDVITMESIGVYSNALYAGHVVNNANIQLLAANGSTAEMDATHGFENNGYIVVGWNGGGDDETISSTVSGDGSFHIYGKSILEFKGSVESGQTIAAGGDDAVILDAANRFAGLITGLRYDDTIDLTHFAPSATSFVYTENADNTSGVLTVTEGAKTATINLSNAHAAPYDQSDFSLGPDSGKGSLIRFV